MIEQPSIHLFQINHEFKTFYSDFLYIEVCFTDQKSKPLQMEDKINITLVINK